MNILQALADCRTPLLDTIFQLITVLAQEVLVIGLICWCYWGRHKQLAYALGFTYFFSGLCIQGMKVTFRIPRPWILDPTLQPVASAIPAATGYSFPSGHTQSGTALFSILGFQLQKGWQKFLCFLMIPLIALSRMYLGVHTPKDVIVSLTVTLVIAILVQKYCRRLLASTSHDLLIMLTLLTLSAGLLIYNLYLYQYTGLPAASAMDCFKAGGAGIGFAIGFYCERRFIRFSPAAGAGRLALRLIPGLTVALLLQQGLKLLLGDTFLGNSLRYCIVVLWILALFPLCFRSSHSR